MIEERDGLATTLHAKQREMETLSMQMSEDAQRSLARLREKDQKILDWEDKIGEVEAKLRSSEKQVCVCVCVCAFACACVRVAMYISAQTYSYVFPVFCLHRLGHSLWAWVCAVSKHQEGSGGSAAAVPRFGTRARLNGENVSTYRCIECIHTLT